MQQVPVQQVGSNAGPLQGSPSQGSPAQFGGVEQAFTGQKITDITQIASTGDEESAEHSGGVEQGGALGSAVGAYEHDPRVIDFRRRLTAMGITGDRADSAVREAIHAIKDPNREPGPENAIPVYKDLLSKAGFKDDQIEKITQEAIHAYKAGSAQLGEGGHQSAPSHGGGDDGEAPPHHGGHE
jgi:hypothetical protein